MADATTVSGKLMFLRYRDSRGSAISKLVCLTDSNYDGNRGEVAEDTNCGKLKDTGTADHKFTGTAVIDTNPDSGEASYAELQTLFINDTEKYWELSDDADTIYHGAYGKISQLGQQNTASGGYAKCTLTVALTGTLDITPSS